MTVAVCRDGAVAVVSIERPDVRNAVDRATAERLADAIRDADADPGVGAIVLAGAGGTFCAGADLRAIAAGDPNRTEPDGDGPMGPTRIETSKPTIAAVEGYAVAGGLELAAWCDLRVAARDATFGVFCRRWGVPLIDGGTIRLPRIVGLGRALDMILTGRAVSAEEAERIGLVDRLCDPGQARDAAVALAASIAAHPAACLRADRASVYGALDRSTADALRAELAGGLAALAAEGIHGATRFTNGEGRGGRPPLERNEER
ncbi:MAG: crotonase/enoyl-CoA hydratase family protein [Myxococcales bacterium]|nr:crotonase/enoyl-CoA hydratase family protein [Myxococcales bacterium]